MPLLQTLIDGLREDLGQPMTLKRALAEHPEMRVPLAEPAPSIDACGVTAWHELGTHSVLHWPRRDRGELLGWRASGSYYDSFHLCRPEYAQIGQREVVPEWHCDITQVHGFGASKSELHRFSSTDAMVEANSRSMISEITEEKLRENLAHDEIRILRFPNTTDHFEVHRWDGRVFLINSGGSHHFAAAKYIASRLQRPVPLRGRLCIYSLNQVAIAALRRDFEMFVVGTEPAASNAFHDAMRAFRATWLWHPLPRPFDRLARAVLLPKNEPRSMRVAHELRSAGFADLGAYLAGLAARQVAH